VTRVAPLETAVLRVGSFEIDVTAGELRRAGRLIKLQPQPFRLLALLASRPGELVTREEIRERLWGEETFVDFEQGENHCIRLVRLALGDDARNPRYVQTVPRRGYRLIAELDAPAPAQSSVETPHTAGRSGHRQTAAVGVLLLLSVIAAVMIPRRSSCPRLAIMPFICLSGDDSREGLAAGLTYEITTELVRRGRDGLVIVSGLSSRRSVITGTGTQAPVAGVDADYLLEGSVQRFADRVRVTAQITDARRLTPIWAETYESDAKDVLVLRSALAGEIATHVQAKLGRRPEPQTAARPAIEKT